MDRRAPLLLVLGCVAAVLCSLLATAPAAAETRRGTDPRGDVRRFDRDGDIVRTGVGNGDIVRYRVSYDRERLLVVMRYRALNFRVESHHASAVLRWRDPDDRVHMESIGVETSPRNRAGRGSLADRLQPCSIRHRVSYRDNRISFRIPSRCFGAPPRVGLFLSTKTNAEPRRFWSGSFDSAPGDGSSGDSLLWVRRG